MSKQLTIALALALTVNVTALASAQSILGPGEDQASTEKGKDRFKTARAGVDQRTSPQHRSGADDAADSKEVPWQLDSPVDDTGLDMDPTIALFLVVSVLLVVVVAIVAASRRDHRQA